MEKLYWTKYILEFDEETNMYVNTGELIPIQESTLGFYPDGDAIAVDMNGISYTKYKKHPERYELVNFKLIEKKD